MRKLKRLANAFLTLLSPKRAEREMDREMSAHLALLAEDFERSGLSPEAARHSARQAFGGLEQAREMHREARTIVWFEQSIQDIRYAWRGLMRSPGFTAVAVLTLALGIGVNTALFTTYNAVALKPMPVADPAHVLRFERSFQSRSAGDIQYAFSVPEFNYCREHSAALGNLVAASWLLAVKGPAAHPKMLGQIVSSNYFEELGIPLMAGGGFNGTPENSLAAVVSYRFWQRAMGSDPSAVGRTVRLNNSLFTIVGITREHFTGTSVNPEVPDFWAPLALQPILAPGSNWLAQPEMRELQIFDRIPPTLPVESARASAELLIRQIDASEADTDPTISVALQRTSYFPNTDDLRFRALVFGLMLLVGLILFAACVNVGNMVLARGAARNREIGARLALGAGVNRIVRQLLTESLVLSAMGGAAGLAASLWATRLLSIALAANAGLIGGDIGAVDLAPDMRVVLYVVVISTVSGILFGLSPALRAARRGISSALKDDLGTTRRSRLTGFLVSAQLTVSVLLLAIAGLLARGMLRARAADPGFDTRGIYVAAGGYGSFRNNPAAATAAMIGLTNRLRILPEVKSIARGSVPFAGRWTPPATVDGAAFSTLASYASDTYPATIGIPLLRGRAFLPRESDTNAPVALVSETTARRFWPGRDPIGRKITLDMNFRGKLKTYEVVGVVGDIRFANLSRLDPAHVYLAGQGDFNGSILLRLNGDSGHAVAAIEKAMNDLAPGVQDAHLIDLDTSFVAGMRALSRGLAAFAAALALLALALAGIGIYGVVAYIVGQRTKEIGVRMALGANAGAVLRGVVFQALRPVFGGIVCGITLAAGFSAILHRTLIFPGSMDLFYGVPFYDPLTFAGLIVFTACLATIASFAPARRALVVDPMVALRYE